MSEPKIKAIETLYSGHLFRSLTEARWAAFFDIMGWRWTYEPQEFNGYIPDFLLHLDTGPLWVEVKGAESTLEGLRRHTEKIEKSGLTGDILLVGNTPVLDAFRGQFAIGLVGQEVVEGEKRRHDFSDALITACCSAGFSSRLYYWRCYNCDERGKGLWHLRDVPPPAVEYFHLNWGEAHQKVRYTPRKGGDPARDPDLNRAVSFAIHMIDEKGEDEEQAVAVAAKYWEVEASDVEHLLERRRTQAPVAKPSAALATPPSSRFGPFAHDYRWGALVKLIQEHDRPLAASLENARLLRFDVNELHLGFVAGEPCLEDISSGSVRLETLLMLLLRRQIKVWLFELTPDQAARTISLAAARHLVEREAREAARDEARLPLSQREQP